MKKTALLLSTLALFLTACDSAAQVSADPWKKAKRMRVEVLAEYPHDTTAFTQGLLWHDGSLYESTGQYGESTLRRVEPTTGRILEQYFLDASLFGEGLERVDDRLVLLTWQSGLALVFDVERLVPEDQFVYRGQGWGLTWDGGRFVMSDGSANLTFRDHETFEVLSTVEVKLDGRSLPYLNELEYVDGEVYANVWQQDRIVRIAPASGRVTAVIDASGLLNALVHARRDVLNGIAYDPDSKTFWITGKYWPKVFQVVFVPADPD